MSTHAYLSEQSMAELGCSNLPAKPYILIGGLGFGFTLRRVLELSPPDACVEVAELLPVIVAWNREFLSEVNGELVDDPRVHIHDGDVAELIAAAGRKNRYHAILLDVDNSPDPFVLKGNASLYRHAGLSLVREALEPGGCVVYWSANPDQSFVRALEKVFGNAKAIRAKAYPQAKRSTHTLFVAER